MTDNMMPELTLTPDDTATAAAVEVPSLTLTPEAPEDGEPARAFTSIAVIACSWPAAVWASGDHAPGRAKKPAASRASKSICPPISTMNGASMSANPRHVRQVNCA